MIQHPHNPLPVVEGEELDRDLLPPALRPPTGDRSAVAEMAAPHSRAVPHSQKVPQTQAVPPPVIGQKAADHQP